MRDVEATMPAIASLEDLKAAQKDLCSKCLTVSPYDLGFTPYDQGFTLCSMRYALCCMEMAPHRLGKYL
jgi:hypothetical protein